MYEKETGIKVKVVQEPWGSFGDRFYTAMAAKGTEWDMVVGDSQWLGTGATSRQYIQLTDFLKKTGLLNSVTPATLRFYGEYPANSAKYWAFPTEGDAVGFAYRKDLFENPKEKADFKAKYGYNLAVPKTYKELYNVAEFFTRKDKGLYGLAIYTQKDYDAITMGVECTLFSYGVEWQDKNNNVMGIINSKKAVEALQMYRDLFTKFSPPGLSNAFFAEMNDVFINGKAAIIMNFFAFFPALSNKRTNPNYWDKVGFFFNPAGPYGDQYSALGGQGLSIISYISPERQKASLDWLKWFGQEKIQAKWAELGGYTCNSKVLKSQTFLKAQPFNPAFAKTMTIVKDFWNIPAYGPLLSTAQAAFHKFVVEGVGTSQETMDNLAKEHDKILRAGGYIK